MEFQGTRRFRRWGVLSAIGAMCGMLLALLPATPASADVYHQVCSGYSGGFKICISYNYTNGVIAANTHNNNAAGSVLLNAKQIIRVGGPDAASWHSATLTRFNGKTWWGTSRYWGHPFPNPQVCAEITQEGSWGVFNRVCATFRP